MILVKRLIYKTNSWTTFLNLLKRFKLLKTAFLIFFILRIYAPISGFKIRFQSFFCLMLRLLCITYYNPRPPETKVVVFRFLLLDFVTWNLGKVLCIPGKYHILIVLCLCFGLLRISDSLSFYVKFYFKIPQAGITSWNIFIHGIHTSQPHHEEDIHKFIN